MPKANIFRVYGPPVFVLRKKPFVVLSSVRVVGLGACCEKRGLVVDTKFRTFIPEGGWELGQSVPVQGSPRPPTASEGAMSERNAAVAREACACISRVGGL
jgi:hypothetical protein